MSDRHLDFDGADAEYVKRLSDDWQVVEEALTNERVAYADWTPDALAALARLREREARMALAISDALGRYQVTHIHEGLREAMKDKP